MVLERRERRDRDKVLHGRETGTVKRLPHGEFVEVHEQLPQGERFRLTAHEQPAPLELRAAVDENGVRGRTKPLARLRARLSNGYFGPQSQIPKPTAEEQAELTGHLGGH